MEHITHVGLWVDDVDETSENYDAVEHIPLVTEIIL
jgi:hypothetical protein